MVVPYDERDETLADDKQVSALKPPKIDDNLKAGEEVVEAIVDHQRAADGTLELKVRWEGFDENFCTWHEESDLGGCKKMIQTYLKSIDGRKCAAAE